VDQFYSPATLPGWTRIARPRPGFVVPEVRVAWAGYAKQSRASMNAGFDGAGGGATMRGVDPGSSHWRLGAGVSGRVNNRVDLRLDYDFDTRRGFRSHNVMAGVGLSF
jgi:opacity protein-like surface antigen